MRIEKNIPIPLRRSVWKNLLNKMSVGDSVLLDNKSQYMSMRKAALGMGFTIAARTIDDKIRVWRMS
jgi:hypothetical protein